MARHQPCNHVPDTVVDMPSAINAARVWVFGVHRRLAAPALLANKPCNSGNGYTGKRKECQQKCRACRRRLSPTPREVELYLALIYSAVRLSHCTSKHITHLHLNLPSRACELNSTFTPECIRVTASIMCGCTQPYLWIHLQVLLYIRIA